jgi:ABC-2 type transport system permease protein
MIFVLISGMNLLQTGILLPIFIIEIYLFALGISLLLSALYVKYRDISYIWDVLMQAGFYATPILYPITLISSVLVQKIIFINPMAQAIQGSRNVFVTSETITISEVWNSNFAVLMPLGIVALFLVMGVLYFKKEAKNFAENL